MKKNFSEVRVRYQETDQMGVVYHSNYFIWFEIGRTSFLRELGYSYKKLEEENIVLPVVEAKCNFRAPAKYDDELIIETEIKEITRARITYEYTITNKANGKLLATGTTTHAFVDQDFKPINFKKTHPGLYESLVEEKN